MSKQIKIAGAGISGLTAAIVLAKAGYQVKVYERNQTVGLRFNEDFQGLMNWGFEEDVLAFMGRIGLKTDFWNTPIGTIDIRGPVGYKHIFRSDVPFCYVVQRGAGERCFDQALMQQALAHGVEIVFGQAAQEEDVDIIATGPKLDGTTDGLVGGYIFETDAPDMFVMVFDDTYAYNGYSYLLIAGGHGTIATCIFGQYVEVGDFLKKTEDFFSRNYSFNIVNKRKFAGTGNFYLLKSKKRYVGEAGGFQDFLWGFGMRYAMLTGYLAAKSIIENKEYRSLWNKELRAMTKTSISLRWLFSLLGTRSYLWFIKYLERQPNPAGFLSRMFHPTLLSRMVYPIAILRYRRHIIDRVSKD